MTDFEALRTAVIKGKRNDVTAIVQAAIDAGEDVNTLLDQGMIPAMREIGDRFSRNEAYVPELLIAARAMQAGLALIEPLIASSGREPFGKIAIGTVKGDLHDIGKNLVVMMMKGAGLEVYDIGVDAEADAFVNKAEEVGADVGLDEDKGVKVIIGGAPVTQAYADEIGADGYSEDANGAVKLVDSLLKRAC